MLCLLVLGLSLNFLSCDDTSKEGADKSTSHQELSNSDSDPDTKKSDCTFEKSKIHNDLKKYIDAACGSETVDIALAFDNTIDVPLESYSMKEIDGKYYLNGKEMSEEMWNAWSKARDDEQTRIAQATYLKRLSIVDEIHQSGLIDDEDALHAFSVSFNALELHHVDACLLQKLTCFKYLISIDPYLQTTPEN